MSNSVRKALIIGACVVLAGAGALWWIVLRDTAPERAALPDRPASAAADDETAAADDTAATETTTQTTPERVTSTPEGSWVIDASSNEAHFVGYRIEEIFAGETVKKTAVGRTSAVEGDLEITADAVVAGQIVADVTVLTSDSGRRDNYLRDRALETDTFADATFVLSEPAAFAGTPVLGEEVALTLVGELTLHGVTRPVQVPVVARWSGDVIDVAGGTTISLSDYDIEVISTTFVTIDDIGELELQLTFVPA